MQQIRADVFLDQWERAAHLPPARRAMVLHALAREDLGPRERAESTAGQRDSDLLRMRWHLFGPRLPFVVACPSCGARLESAAYVDDLLIAHPGEVAMRCEDIGGFEVQWRLPNVADLSDVEDAPSEEVALLRLIASCVRDRDGEPISSEMLSPGIVEKLSARMGEADPQADLQFAFACLDCGHGWHDTFDIAAYLWIEFDAWARRTLRDVDALARAYGWREPDILALSPTRRQRYIELAGS